MRSYTALFTVTQPPAHDHLPSLPGRSACGRPPPSSGQGPQLSRTVCGDQDRTVVRRSVYAMRSPLRHSVLFALLFALVSCALAELKKEETGLWGVVHCSRYGLLPGVRVGLELEDWDDACSARELATVTDEAGHYQFKGLQAGTYSATFTKDGYRPVSSQVSISWRDMTALQMNVDLKLLVAQDSTSVIPGAVYVAYGGRPVSRGPKIWRPGAIGMPGHNEVVEVDRAVAVEIIFWHYGLSRLASRPPMPPLKSSLKQLVKPMDALDALQRQPPVDPVIESFCLKVAGPRECAAAGQDTLRPRPERGGEARTPATQAHEPVASTPPAGGLRGRGVAETARLTRRQSSHGRAVSASHP